MRNRVRILNVFFAGMLASTAPTPAHAQVSLLFSQQGPKLVGTGAVGQARQGVSVALSGDGMTAIVGGSFDDDESGAAWVFTRSSGGVWTQQGPKLVGTGAVGGAFQGVSVALSGDGNTALVGGSGDDNGAGAVWIFRRSNGVWTQEGPKLVGAGAINPGPDGVQQGWSVALSSNGNTAIVGGPGDNSDAGAAWIFARGSNGNWTQQGNKLVGAGAINPGPDGVQQGSSVALSANGNTAIVGGPGDNTRVGAAWIFTRDSHGNWSQQGNKLVGSMGVLEPQEGYSVALSGDGNTAMLGGPTDDSSGAAWIFTRDSDGNWSQQGSKLVGSGAVEADGAEQGFSVALSGDGNTAILGGPFDEAIVGAAWIFERDRTGNWAQQGSKLVGSGGVGPDGQEQGFSVALSGDGNTALVGGPLDNDLTGAVWVFARTIACDTTYSGTYKGNLTISSGQVCIINGTITGNVVQNGGVLATNNGTIQGNLQITNGTFLVGPGSAINGNLQVQNVSASEAQDQICGAAVRGDLQLQNNQTAAEIGSNSTSCPGNQVGGNLQIMNNTAPVQVFDNVVSNNLQCQNNLSITGSGNTAKQKQGQCAAF